MSALWGSVPAPMAIGGEHSPDGVLTPRQPRWVMATATASSTFSTAAASGQGADDNYAATGQPGEATTAGGPSGDPNSAGSQGGSAASACRRPNARSRSTNSRASCVWTSHRQSSPPIGPIRSAIARPTRRRCSPPHRNRPPAPQGPRQSLGLIRHQPPFRHPLAQPRQ